ncbi:ATP synthase F0 subunit B, partial [Pseudomonas sp. FW305-BF8]
EEISAEKAKVLAEIRTHVVDLTLQASAKVVGENMDNDRNRRMVQEFIDGIEVKV